KTDLNIGKWVNQPLSASLKSPVFLPFPPLYFEKSPAFLLKQSQQYTFFHSLRNLRWNCCLLLHSFFQYFFTFIIYCIFGDITKTTDLPFTKLIRKFYIPPLNKEYVIMNHTYNKRIKLV